MFEHFPTPCQHLYHKNRVTKMQKHFHILLDLHKLYLNDGLKKERLRLTSGQLLSLVDDKKARQESSRIEHQKRFLLPTHRVEPVQERFQRRADPAGHHPADQHGPPTLVAAGHPMGGAAAGEGPNRRPFPRERAEPGGVSLASSGGRADTVEPHHLVAVDQAPGTGRRGRRRRPPLHRLPVLLEPGDGGGGVADLEQHLDPRRGSARRPAGVEDDLHHLAGGVSGGELDEGGEGGGGRQRRRRGRRRRSRGAAVVALLGGCGGRAAVVVASDDVVEGGEALAAAGEGEVPRLVADDVLRRHELALQRLHPPRRHFSDAGGRQSISGEFVNYDGV